MRICGLNKTTLLDYPGHVAATVFVGGCNFRCPYCHNSDLLLNNTATPSISMEELNSFLVKRKNILSGICITGGEPTLYPDLPMLIKNIKDFGYLVKLDTNGTNPEMIKELLSQNLPDYIAMDIKSDKETYALAAGLTNADAAHLPLLNLSSIETSVNMIKSSGIDYEFRTTVVKELHTKQVFENIANWLDGSRSYFLQNYRENENVLHPGFHSYTKEELDEFALILEGHCEHVGIRGV